MRPPTPADPECALLALIEQTGRMLAVSLALVRSVRRVDLRGLQQQVGLLCAKALDLPRERSGFVRLELVRLSAQLDELQAAMRAQAR